MQVQGQEQASFFARLGAGTEGELASGTCGRWMLYIWIASALWLVLVWRIVDGY